LEDSTFSLGFVCGTP